MFKVREKKQPAKLSLGELQFKIDEAGVAFRQKNYYAMRYATLSREIIPALTTLVGAGGCLAAERYRAALNDSNELSVSEKGVSHGN